MLERIQKENDIKKLNSEELECLAEEIREFLVEKVSKTGGHLASNLGVVELTMALHLICDLPKDKIIWDVGHQSYTHKLLTGRKEGFEDLRSYGGMSGFPKRKESQCDAFDTGHSSTSISAGLGYVRARDLKHEDYTVISVIGDGSLTGGMAYEALNNASNLKTNFIVVLNDNHMSISENVGGMSRYLTNLRTADIYTGLKKGVTNALQQVPVMGDRMIEHIRKTKSSIKQLVVPGMFFEDMGITYLGPIPGHNLPMLCKALKEAKKVEGPVLLHVMTTKGKGYEPAETAPDKFHGIGPFDIESGKVLAKKDGDTYTDVFGKVLCDEASRNPDIVAITAAMADGTGLARFKKHYPNRFFDVGIAEEHGVTFAAGLAAGGLKPVFAVYSSFLQRGYDQLIHDVALQNLPVVFGVDRAGLVGSDGETHQGIFDLSFLSNIPNMTVMSPKNKWELADMLRFALQMNSPVAIRYPRGKAYDGYEGCRERISYGKSEWIFEGKEIAILSVGHMFEEAVKTRDKLIEQGYEPTLINMRFIKPIDEAMIEKVCQTHKLIAVIEENVQTGACGERVSEYVMRKMLPSHVLTLALPDDYIEHGSVDVLRKMTGIDSESMSEKIIETYKEL
ncbi:1-deoxy-D-xylulose-5-phosphate synthase [Dorea formicigenerans]|uniref:1-deoxy-D-xylulose-5-phosphate synthase n=1 Tax=Dorea formicigenerans TaxID=39486 RepID=UPI001D08B942|nr:1-deoxy-D-xylulose-5-phosphate synthase [Dorea formicigenerans]MCC3183588.1 1-deoxy-D-xylulose-5-phosphate synthase [[Clostridium] innocuum]MCB6281769.1 1-deoxy-D-xylulose-5-phosphate synthase [Dorea formicigenerans]MCB6379037.1 1-deoxy-D-xylulose-5-phosphate synthase [Dorea formicigenerans]MCB6381970.1 1-deoxy-D-xylulose-5-phosphate synthase [Dorea formicigenerans]MCB6387251.1 1-deoxy-D-xylulose-5-phosphate synthase [Dorea formicigenerans]